LRHPFFVATSSRGNRIRPKKDEANRAKHGISLLAASNLDLAEAIVVEDRRYNYGEARFLAYAPIAGRLYVLYFTMRGSMLRNRLEESQ
jgi:uncharacterized DUF497 family protein